MFITKFGLPYFEQFTYSEQLQASNNKLTFIEQVKKLVENIYINYNNITYKLLSDANIAKAAISICLYNLCGLDPTHEDDQTINDCYEEIRPDIENFIIISRQVLELNCPYKIQDKTAILDIAEYLCKVIQSEFNISNHTVEDAQKYKRQIEKLLVFLAKHSCVHCVGWPNTNGLAKQFLEDANYAIQTSTCTCKTFRLSIL